LGADQSRSRPTETRICGQRAFTYRCGCGFLIRQNDGKKGEVYGFDGGKKGKGRKRHVIVDSLGQIMKVLCDRSEWFRVSGQGKDKGGRMKREVGSKIDFCFPFPFPFSLKFNEQQCWQMRVIGGIDLGCGCGYWCKQQ